MKPAKCFAHLKLETEYGKIPEYGNINDIVTIDDRLHMCETLYGDLNAKVMVLGQDGAHFGNMQALVRAEGAPGYRHGENVQTNINLIECLSEYTRTRVDGSIDPKDCGVFYANAVWLLKNGDGMAARLPRLMSVLRECAPVMKATIEGLPKLELIIAMGNVAYRSLRLADNRLNGNWQNLVENRTVCDANLFCKPVKVAAVLHPSPLSGGRDVTQLKTNFKHILKTTGLL